MDGSLGYIISALILLEIARSQMKPFTSSQREERRHHHSNLAVIYYREFVSFQCHRLMGNPLWAPELSSLLHASPTLGPWQCLWLWCELNFTVQYRWGWGACKQTRIADCPFLLPPKPTLPPGSQVKEHRNLWRALHTERGTSGFSTPLRYYSSVGKGLNILFNFNVRLTQKITVIFPEKFSLKSICAVFLNMEELQINYFCIKDNKEYIIKKSLPLTVWLHFQNIISRLSTIRKYKYLSCDHNQITSDS